MSEFFSGRRGPKGVGLRPMILAVLSRGPLRGIEVIDQIEAMTLGWWRPSPGSVYPALSSLVQEGILIKDEEGRYSLTEAGRRELESSPAYAMSLRRGGGSVREVLNEVEGYLSYLSEMPGEMLKREEASLERISQGFQDLVKKLRGEKLG